MLSLLCECYVRVCVVGVSCVSDVRAVCERVVCECYVRVCVVGV